MADSRQRTLVSVRATLGQNAQTVVFARSRQTELGPPFSFDIAEPSLTGAENLLGLLASDVMTLFRTVARRRRLIVDRVEATVKAELDASLRYLGVIGADGIPAYKAFQLKLYVDSPEEASRLNDAWNEATSRSPLLNTLKHAASIDISMQVVA